MQQLDLGYPDQRKPKARKGNDFFFSLHSVLKDVVKYPEQQNTSLVEYIAQHTSLHMEFPNWKEFPW